MKKYINLVKPGIIFSNLFTAFTGVFIASYGSFNFSLVLFTLLGLLLVLMSSTTLNNYIDRDIDKFMERTKNRASVVGVVSGSLMIFLSALFGILGCLILLFFTNLLTFGVVLFGYFVYIGVYSIYAKRNTKHSTFLGSFSGAILPLAGYTAISGKIDPLGVSLFLILLVWQMPHFYAIGIFRLEDYKRCKLPILPVVKSIHYTKIHIFIWTILFLIVSLLPYFLGYSGKLYGITVFIINLFWIIIAVRGFKASNSEKWARVVFFYSIFNLLAVCVIIMLDKILTYGG